MPFHRLRPRGMQSGATTAPRGGGAGFGAAHLPGGPWQRGFTLVEMLTVIGVIVVLLALIGPVVNGLKGAGDINKAVYDIAGILTQARTFAMANDTYVYAGFEEVDASQPESASPQAVGVGKLKLALVATNDGTAGYSPLSPGDWATNYQTSLVKNLQQIGKTQSFDNVHLINLGIRPATGSMARPPYGTTDAIDQNDNLGDTQCSSVTSFSVPLGSAAPPTGGKFNFVKVIQFSPQGVARIQNANNGNTVAPWLEVGMQKSNGSQPLPAPAAPATTGNVVAIQINGITGSVRIYRP